MKNSIYICYTSLCEVWGYDFLAFKMSKLKRSRNSIMWDSTGSLSGYQPPQELFISDGRSPELLWQQTAVEGIMLCMDWHQKEVGNVAGVFCAYLLAAEEWWESVTLAPAPGCREKCIHIFLPISQAEIPSVLSLKICTVPISSSTFIPCYSFQCSCFQSSIKTSIFVKFLENSLLMYGV